MKTIRCLGCRKTFEKPESYLSHECEPDPATAAGWEDVEIDVEPLLASLGRLGDSLDEIDAILAELDDEDDPFFGPDDLDEPLRVRVFDYVVLGIAGFALVGFAVYEGLASIVRRIQS